MAEWRLQPRFIFSALATVGAALLLRGDRPDERPNRLPQPPRTVPLRVMSLPVPRPSAGGWAIGGLWELSASGSRFGGWSALAWDGGQFIALSDSGVVGHWRKTGGTVRLSDLPNGPGSPRWKVNRDSEALLRAPNGDGWWVAFEQHHSLFRFDDDFTRTLQRRPVELRSWWRNWGIEALARLPNGNVLALTESGDTAIEMTGSGQRNHPLQASGQVADAVQLKDGRTLLALREVRPWGIRNRIGVLQRRGEGFEAVPGPALPLGRWDNVEGLAAEPLAGGQTRLWFVTDNDFRRRTLLGWIEVPVLPRPQAGRARRP